MHKKSLLIVDDELIIRESLSEWFLGVGFDVENAGSAEAALKKLDVRHDFDVMIVDMKMPGMDGLTLTREVKHKYPEIKIVVITAYGTIDYAVEAFKSGVDDFFTKPFDTEKLEAAVKALVGKKIIKHIKTEPQVPVRVLMPAEKAECKVVPGYRILDKKNFKAFIDAMIEGADVVGPVAKGKKFVFDRVKSSADVRMDYDTTLLPPKKFLLPQSEVLVKFRTGPNPEAAAPHQDGKPFVLFGVHPCDIKAIHQLDWLMTENNLDSAYTARRNAAVVVGMDCLPHEECFCDSVDSSDPRAGYDLFLTDIGSEYIVSIGSIKGLALLNHFATTREACPKDVRKIEAFREKKAGMMKGKLSDKDLHTVINAFESTVASPIWDELAKKCLGCGSCNAVCPTCYCFDVNDTIDVHNLEKGERTRKWDGCMLESFAVVASGENFREARRSRLRHRLFRKYKYLPEKYGQFFCVGCGRCVRACLVKIDPVEVANRIVEEVSKCQPSK